jgi:hypothetical protein
MATTEDIKTIRAAVERNRGGWEAASDNAVIELWSVLSPETRKAYLASLPLAVSAVVVDAPQKGKGGK